MAYADNRDQYVTHGIAIINPYGGVWTDRLFKTPKEAADYLRSYWKDIDRDLGDYRLAEATQTLAVKHKPGEPMLVPLPSPVR